MKYIGELGRRYETIVTAVRGRPLSPLVRIKYPAFVSKKNVVLAKNVAN